MPWAEIIKLLLPIIIELIGNKKKKPDASVQQLVACWNSPQGLHDFVSEVCSRAEANGEIKPAQKLDVVLAFAEVAESPLAPLFIEYLYEMSDA